MIDFSHFLDLPLIWGGLIATAVFLYVILDGFDLGCGILFPFAPSENSRNRIMNSIAPFWDGNETWLVLGAGGMFVAFPVAYAILMPAFYIPVMVMLMGLIFRGVAFEFRFKAGDKDRPLWNFAFHVGSLTAAFMQGVILGNFIQGVEVAERAFAGGALDWANGFAIVTGIAMIFGYALLGATWLILKTDKDTQIWARRVARYVIGGVAVSMAIVSVTMPFLDTRIANLWFDTPTIYYLLPLPILTSVVFVVLWFDLQKGVAEVRPFLLTLALFLLGYMGFAASLFPWIVPFQFTLWEAAAVSTSQTILLIGTVALLPIILGYTGYCYYVFRGKSDSKHIGY